MNETVRIGTRTIGSGHPVFIVAEIGMNHNGDFSLAEHMVRAAAAAGVDAVKFQSFKTDLFLSNDIANRDERRQFELPNSWLPKLVGLSNDLGIEFFSTPLDQESADVLDRVGVPCFKVASCDLNNYPFLEYIARKGRPIILSTGFSSLGEIEQAVCTVRDAGNTNLILLHCVALYPAPLHAVNLRVIKTLSQAFRLSVGFSDHTIDSLVAPLAAVALGATVLEKHFTMDRNLAGYDHAISETPVGMEQLVKEVRACSAALGSGLVLRAPKEIARRENARRSLYWSSNAMRDEVVTSEMLVALRPGFGMPPRLLPDIVGRRLAKNVGAGEVVKLEDINWANR